MRSASGITLRSLVDASNRAWDATLVRMRVPGGSVVAGAMSAVVYIATMTIPSVLLHTTLPSIVVGLLFPPICYALHRRVPGRRTAMGFFAIFALTIAAVAMHDGTDRSGSCTEARR